MKLKAHIAGALLALFVGSALPANAAIIDWTIEVLTFSDGGTGSGTFAVDSVTDALTAYDITTSAGTEPGYNGTVFGGQVYDSATVGTAELTGDGWLTLFLTKESQEAGYYLTLGFSDLGVSELDTPGVAKIFCCGSSIETFGASNLDYRFVTGAVADGTLLPSCQVGCPSPTPLPAALPLFAGGLGLLGFVAGRRKAQAAA